MRARRALLATSERVADATSRRSSTRSPTLARIRGCRRVDRRRRRSRYKTTARAAPPHAGRRRRRRRRPRAEHIEGRRRYATAKIRIFARILIVVMRAIFAFRRARLSSKVGFLLLIIVVDKNAKSFSVCINEHVTFLPSACSIFFESRCAPADERASARRRLLLLQRAAPVGIASGAFGCLPIPTDDNRERRAILRERR